jgi:DNA-binding NarL/FixJ family response regulator
LRVLLADDHVPTRSGVRGALEAHGMVVCAEVGTGEEAVDAASEQRPDVCLLDVQMPGMGGIDEFRNRDARRRIPVLRPGSDPLTERESEVLELMAQGLGTRQISDLLKISEVTVRRHVSAVLRKLQVRDRAAAVDLLRRARPQGRRG